MERARISVQKGRRVPRGFLRVMTNKTHKEGFFVFVHVTWPATVAAPLDEVEPVTEKRIGGLR